MIHIRQVASFPIGYVIERLSDGKFYKGGTFTAIDPANPPVPTALVAGTGVRANNYSLDVDDSDVDQFTPGEYCLEIRDMSTNLPTGAIFKFEIENQSNRNVLGFVAVSR